MKQLLEFIPLIVFFLFYKMDPKTIEFSEYQLQIGGIYSATYALIVATSLVYLSLLIKNKKLEKNGIITLIAVFLFGGMTLAFRNESFLKWKAPIVNWIFALILFGSQFLGKKPIMQQILEKALTLPASVWKSINISWALFFVCLGSANLYVAFNHHKYWVDFKVFGSILFTLLFTVLQIFFIYKYLPKKTTK